MFVIEKAMEENKIVGKSGIKFIDDYLVGVMLTDLWLIGARSGAGKSTIANLIASNNVNNKVSLFSLENFKYDLYLEKAYYYYKKATGNYSLSQRKFVAGAGEFDKTILKEAEEYAINCFKGINIIHRKPKYDIAELKSDIIREAEQNDSKLIILDHLDYVSKYGNESDNAHVNELMRTIREVQDAFKIAVVAVSHLRKTTNLKDSPIIPSMEEFIGSSNKYKEATAVIMLAPDDEGNLTLNDKTRKGTWCCIRKLRMGGVDNRAAKLWFNTNTGQYEDLYHLYRVNYAGTKTELILADKK